MSTAIDVRPRTASRPSHARLLGWSVDAGQAMKILHNCHVTELRYTENRGWQLHAHNVR